MREITMNSGAGRSFKEVFEEFVISKTAQGVSEATLDNYHYHMKNISHYLDTERAFDDIKKKDIEIMAVAMRKAGIKHNSIATYLRMLKTFYNWCKEENLSSIIVPTFNEKETVKETYTDEELSFVWFYFRLIYSVIVQDYLNDVFDPPYKYGVKSSPLKDNSLSGK